MPSQKLENLLNLALDTPMEERERSLELNVGYERVDNSWELIVKYHGSLRVGLAPFFELPGGDLIRIEELIAGYAILTVPEPYIDSLAQVEEIEYIEKPKRLFFEVLQGKIASCIVPGSQLETSLRGRGVIVAVIDSGIAWRNADFRNPDGTSRILYLWDQTLQSGIDNAPPEGFYSGVEFSKRQLDMALSQPDESTGNLLVPSIDTSGHGTAVAGIAAGNGAASGGVYAGVAPESELIVVKLGTPGPDSFPRTTELMRALTYVVKKSLELQRPVAINLSFGNTYGAHNGTSLLERFIDNVSEIGRSVICVGSGNEGASGGHVGGSLLTDAVSVPGAAAGRLARTDNTLTNRVNAPAALIELVVGNYEFGLNVQLWKDYADTYEIRLISPGGESIVIDTDTAGKQTYVLEQTKILLYNGEPAPYLTSQEIYFDLLPGENAGYINSGVWTFELKGIKLITGNYAFYLPSETVRSRQTRFLRPTPDVTLTIPSTAAKVITVGAYQASLDAYADFSGRGYLYQDRVGSRTESAFVKPDLTAPGVNIMAPDRNGGYEFYSGTSFATPFVTGAAALLMQWGITDGNDPYLYGEKIKAYLRKGAAPIRGERYYPNERTGYGALCVADSIPF